MYLKVQLVFNQGNAEREVCVAYHKVLQRADCAMRDFLAISRAPEYSNFHITF